MDEERRKELLKYYELYHARYNAIFPMVYQDLKFYAGLSTAALGGSLVLVKDQLTTSFSSPGYFAPIVLIFGGAAVIMLSRFGAKGVSHSYDAYMRAISTLAKIESDLGMHDESTRPKTAVGGNQLWTTESLVHGAELSNAHGSSSSNDFVRARTKAGYGETSRKFFFAIAIGGGAEIAIGLIQLGLQF